MSSTAISPLGPIDPKHAVPENEQETEQKAPWIIRKLVGSMTGRIVMSSYQSLRAAGTSVICLSPWGDSSPLVLPCIRFRDLAVHAVVVGTGGLAGVAAPVMGPVADVAISTFGNTIIVDIALKLGAQGTQKIVEKYLIEAPVEHVCDRIKSPALETTGLTVLSITLKHKLSVTDAYLGFYRSSVHKDNSLFSTVMDYLAIEKGWFNPYLFASARRPVIPRSMKPDVVFCHGPFLEGDYMIGEGLLSQSATRIYLCDPPVQPTEGDLAAPKPSYMQTLQKKLSLPKISNPFKHHDAVEQASTDESHPRPSSSPEPQLTQLPAPVAPRRIVILLIGIKPHRSLWTTSARPGESVIQYAVMNGCPAIVIPARIGAPLVAWDTLTLRQLWKIALPTSDQVIEESPYAGIVNVLLEYVDLCTDWERVVVPSTLRPATTEDDKGPMTEDGKKKALKAALQLLVASGIRTQENADVKKEVDPDRAGIAFWRMI